MLVLIVCVANPDNTGIDMDRINKVEDLPDEIAQKMIDGGTGRIPSEAELAAYRESLDAEPQLPYDDGGFLEPSTVARDIEPNAEPAGE